ncbi:hypothetical protein YA0089_26705 [Pseudomonas viridiflava]|uniref:hypothetical protein n=1 Tax=Pseudomonas viridiflava TaxID=33069 RepID=UPI0018E63AFB|nr:hypothetical protein [Pseudomonas viridiflava]MBI6727209.1 hypothetical protein [Pseudomonas viridiflava]
MNELKAWQSMKAKIGIAIIGCTIALLVCAGAIAATYHKTPPLMIACNLKGMAFAKISSDGDIPWVMTDSGPVPGNQPGASLGYAMTCDEVMDAFNL